MTTISITETPNLTRQFFIWWGTELKSLVPRKLIDGIQTSSNDYTVRIGPDNISIVQRKNPQEQQTLDFGTETEPDQEQLLQAAKTIRNLGIRTVRKCWIDDRHILRKRIELPKTAQNSNLPLIIQNQIQKLTPFSPDEVLVDFCQLGPRTDNNEIVCEIAIIHKKHVASYLRLLSSLDLHPDFLCHQAKIQEEEKSFSFSLSKRDTSSRSLISGFKTALLFILIFLIVTIFALPLYRQNEQIQQLEAITESNKENAQIAARIIGDISEISEDYNFIVQKKSSIPSKTEILNELSSILPAHTWVFSLVEGKEKIELQGYSENTSEIIPLIETSPFFTEVNLSSGIVRNTKSAKERFHLNFKIAGRKVQ